MTASPPLLHSSAPSVSRPGLQVALLLMLYFGAHLLIRTLTAEGLELDEAEQALWAQHLALGYGAQPPLYTWLQWMVFQIFGMSVFSLALLKNLLLALTYVFTYLAARIVMPPRLAAFASACMLLLPQIGWESQRDLTHSVLLTTLAAATLLLTLRLLRRPTPLNYLLLGLAIGLGLLSKYSYAPFVAVLALATLCSPRTRQLWRSPWMIATVVLAALIASPHAIWAIQQSEAVMGDTLRKLDPDPATSGTGHMFQGIGSAALAAVSFLALWAIAMAASFGRAAWPRKPSDGSALPMDAAHRSLWRSYFAILAAMFVGMAVLGDMTHFKDRWMQPFLFCAPLAFFGCAPHLADHPRLTRLRGILATMALLVIVMIALRPFVSAWRDKPGQWNLPAAALASALRAGGYDGRATILTSDRDLGGTLLLQFPLASVYIGPRPELRGPFLVIDKNGTDAGILALAGATRADGPEPDVNRIDLDYLHARPGAKPLTYRYVLIDPDS